MSLESLFQHILFTEHQAEESRRAMREGQGPALGACCLWELGIWTREEGRRGGL